MTFSGYILAVLLLCVCVYTLNGCLKGFRRAPSSKRINSYLYAFGAAITFGMMGLILIAMFLSVVGPLH